MTKGQILIAVLLIFVILSLIMAGVLNIWEGNVRKVGAQKGEKQALYLAEGGAEVAIYSVIWSQNPSSFTLSGNITETDFSGRYTVSLFWYSPTFEIVSTGTVDLWSRTLIIEGTRSGTIPPYTITITLWSEE
jgi:uncharacterized protein (UPF0333 family)